MRSVLQHAPFALKDPRFSYTLNAWRPLVNECRFLVVFRHPAATCNSMVSFARNYYPEMPFDFGQALRVWLAMYRQILEFHYDHSSNWLFVEFQDVLDGTAVWEIERFLDVNIDCSFADPQLVHAGSSGQAIPVEAEQLYGQLRELSHVDRYEIKSCLSNTTPVVAGG